MNEETNNWLNEAHGGRAAWLSWLPGPFAWALHQTTSFALTGWVCETGNLYVLHVATILTVLVAGFGLWIGVRVSLANRKTADRPRDRLRTRRRFLALVGVLICTVSLAGIVLESIPNIVLDACSHAT